jgi:hypothetical protein
VEDIHDRLKTVVEALLYILSFSQISSLQRDFIEQEISRMLFVFPSVAVCSVHSSCVSHEQAMDVFL